MKSRQNSSTDVVKSIKIMFSCFIEHCTHFKYSRFFFNSSVMAMSFVALILLNCNDVYLRELDLKKLYGLQRIDLQKSDLKKLPNPHSVKRENNCLFYNYNRIFSKNV